MNVSYLKFLSVLYSATTKYNVNLFIWQIFQLLRKGKLHILQYNYLIYGQSGDKEKNSTFS